MKEKNGYPAWNNNPEVFEINRLPARTIFTGFSQPADALAAANAVPGSSGHTLPPLVLASGRCLPLNGIWKFHLADRPSDRPADFFQSSFDSSQWKNIKVPAHWQMEGWDYPQYTNIRYPWEKSESLVPPFAPEKYNPVGSYLRTFTVPSEWKGMETVISFQGVESAFYIWLNGTLVGYSEDSFTPAEFDLTPFLCAGENLLAVEVYRWCDASWLEDQDFWRLSGIFRDVFLFARPPVHIYDYQAKSSLDPSFHDGVLDLEIDIRLSGSAVSASHPTVTGSAFTLEISIFAPDGRAALPSRKAACSVNVNSEFEKVPFHFELPAVRPWSAEIPELYTVLVVFSDTQDRIIESTAFRTGFRTFCLKDGLLLLNGKRIVFYGVNRHEFNMESGRCIGAGDMIRDVMEMKRNNINAVRTSHYPNSLLWYDLCDYYGLYVIDETNLETHGTWQFGSMEQNNTALPGDRAEWTACVLDRARSMYFRDRNHSSILIWSLGNESYGGTNHLKMHDFFAEVDPDRVVHYEGIFHCRSAERASDMESQMYTPASGLVAYSKEYEAARTRGIFHKPFILCEYSHAMGNSCGGLHIYTDLFKTHRCLQGGFIWDWIDQALLTKTASGIPYLAYGGDFGEVPNDGNFSGNGLVFADRSVTPKLAEVKACYQQYDFSFEDNSVFLVRVTDRTLFKGFDGLRFVWKILGDGAVIVSGVGEPVAGDTGGAWVCAGAKESLAAESATAESTATFSGGKELILETHLVHSADTPWAPEGTSVASAQFILDRSAPKPFVGSSDMGSSGASGGQSSLTIARNDDGSFSIQGPSVTLEFSAMGELRSLAQGKAVHRFASFRPDFYRAPTDNDRGNLFAERLGLWKIAAHMAGAFPRIPLVSETPGKITVSVAYSMPPILSASCSLMWEIFDDGRITLTQRLSPGKAMHVPEIPFVGIEAVLQTPVPSFEWYGFGPHENYIDRRKSALLGDYQATPESSFTHYLKPQECGNRTGVRILRVDSPRVDSELHNPGGAIVFRSRSPFEFSLLPWTREELEKARHTYELPLVTKSVLRLGMIQMGVGGDNSWGAQTLPEFLVASENDYEWSVDISVSL